MTAQELNIGDRISWLTLANGKVTKLTGTVTDKIEDTMICEGKDRIWGRKYRDIVSVHDKTITKL